MLRLILIAVCIAGLTSAGVSKQLYHAAALGGSETEESHNFIVVHTLGGYELGGHSGKFYGSSGSNGAELTSFAHSSAVQAKNAVQNQQTAGRQAAFGIANSFASAALGAAQTAQAALVGKQAIVQNLKRQLTDAQRQLQEEITQYQQAEATAQAAQRAAEQAQSQLSSLAAALSSVQGGADNAQQAATEAAKANAAQQYMVIEAKQRVAHILSHIHNAVAELQETEASALKAAEAAHIAKSNAAAAGAAVATSNFQAAGSKIGHHY